jgi:hypothetical protein
VWRIFCIGLALLVLALWAFRRKGGFDELARVDRSERTRDRSDLSICSTAPTDSTLPCL